MSKPTTIEEAQELYDTLPDDMKEIAKLFMENIILGKDKENDKIFEEVKEMAEKEDV